MRNSILAVTVLLLLAAISTTAGALGAQPSGAVSAPVLKWSRAGCLNGIWCDTGWYASPAVADIDNDGKPEALWTNYKIFAINGEDGSTQWSVPNPGGGRGWASVVVGDINNNNSLEIVTAHSGGYLSVLQNNGTPLAGFPRQDQSNELRSLAVSDVDDNGDLEILVCATRSQDQWFIYEHNGTIRSGWPRHSPDSDTNGYAAGCYNENVGLADLDGDGRDEMIGPNDTHYVVGFNDDGSPLRAHAMYGQQAGQNKVWARVGFHYDHSVDLRGYANCGVEHRPNFADSAPTFADVNGDGVLEIIIVGNIYNCGTSPYTSLFQMPFILRVDRTRWAGNGFDWTALPVPDGNAAPLSEDYNQIETVMPNPVVVDLDNDGLREILFSSYDGRLHAYWLDKTEHGNWPYNIKKQNENFIRFSSEPAVADLDNDGLAEVIVTTWTEHGSNAPGQVLILGAAGNLLRAIDLPTSDDGWDGAMAAPTIANLDNDADYELVIGTANTGLVAYDLPNTANARILWGTGRGDYLRHGQAPAAASSSGTPTPTHTATPCAGAPPPPKLKAPKNDLTVDTRFVLLDWKERPCATRYEVIVRRNSSDGKIIQTETNVVNSEFTTKRLKRAKTHVWQVRACFQDACGGWSKLRRFVISPTAQ